MTKPREADTKQFARQALETELRKIPYCQLVVKPEEYAFRDDDELSGPSMRSFEDEITASHGVNVPVIVRDLADETFLILDGHLRHLALGNLIERKVKGFHPGMLIPA